MVSGAPRPVAPYSHATAANGWVFVTGQVPTDPDDGTAPLPDGIEAQTRRVFENLKRVLAGSAAARSTESCLRVSISPISNATTRQ